MVQRRPSFRGLWKPHFAFLALCSAPRCRDAAAQSDRLFLIQTKCHSSHLQGLGPWKLLAHQSFWKPFHLRKDIQHTTLWVIYKVWKLKCKFYVLSSPCCIFLGENYGDICVFWNSCGNFALVCVKLKKNKIKKINIISMLKKNLAMPHGMQGLCSPTVDWVHAPCSGSTESSPLDHQGSPQVIFY